MPMNDVPADQRVIDTAARLSELHANCAILIAKEHRSAAVDDRAEYTFWLQVCDLLEREEL